MSDIERIPSPECNLWLYRGGILLFLGLMYWGFRPFLMDDAYITLRCADHLLQGKGLIFNTNEYVYAITNPLWGAWISFASYLFGSLESTLSFFAIASFAMAALLFFELVRKQGFNNIVALLITFVFVLNPMVYQTALSGMETPLVLCLLFGILLLHSRMPKAAYFLAGILLFVRVDGLLVGGTLFLFDVFHGKRQWNAWIVYAVVVLGYLLFGYFYFDQMLPNSALTKMATRSLFSTEHIHGLLLNGKRFFLAIGGNFPYGKLPFAHLVFIPLMVWSIFRVKKSRFNSSMILLMLYTAIYMVALLVLGGHDVNFAWYYVLPLPGMYLLIASAFQPFLGKIGGKYRWTICAVVMAGLTAQVMKNTDYQRRYFYDVREANYRAVAKWSGQFMKPGMHCITNEIGTLGYFSTSDIIILDLNRLTQPAEDRQLDFNGYFRKYDPELVVYLDFFESFKGMSPDIRANYQWLEYNGTQIGIHKKLSVNINALKHKPIFYATGN